jgi:hypothetical protein
MITGGMIKLSVKTGFLLIAGLLTLQINAQEGWKASEETVRKLSGQRSEFNYYEEKVPAYTLPDPLKMTNGRDVKNARAWTNGRREEVLELFRTNVFGRMPSTPYEQKFTTINTDRNAMSGAATLKEIDIEISSGGKSLVIHLVLFTPNNISKPVPAFLLINNRGQANIDPSRERKSEFWPAEEVIKRGYAIAAFNNSDVDPDNFDGFRDGIHGILDNGIRNDDSWGTLAAWAWGASRCMDYLATDKDINPQKVAVVGHSRGGKTALWAGAEDTRFAMVVSNESGCGGAALARRRFGETVAQINKSFPHWFCLNFRKFNGNEDALPVDMHMLLALTAPRALYVASAGDDLWGDPRGSYLSLYHAVPVFRLFGKTREIPEATPPLNTPLVSGKIAYHVRDGGHNMLLRDWNFFMDFSDRVLK